MSNSEELAIKVFGTTFSVAILFIIFMMFGFKNTEKYLEKSPMYKIDYIDNNGKIKYTRYSSNVQYNRGNLNYIDFYTKNKVIPKETTEVSKIR